MRETQIKRDNLKKVIIDGDNRRFGETKNTF